MPSKAHGTFIGHAGKDSELRFTQGGQPVLSFSMATSRWRGKDKEPLTTWWQVDLWGQRAESLNGRGGVRKGELVTVFGEPYQDEPWTDNQGAARVTLRINADDVLLMARREDADRETVPTEGRHDTPF